MRDHTRTRAAGFVAVLFAGALCAGCSAGDPEVHLQIRIVQEAPASDLSPAQMKVWGGQLTYYAHHEALLTEEDVASAMVVKQSNGAPAMKVILNRSGREKLLQVTRNNVGDRLGVFINGQLQSTSPIDGPDGTGIIMVTGHMLERAAQKCSRALTRGAA